MAISDQITRLENAKADIQAALTRKGFEMSGLGLHQFATKIDEIPGATLQPFSYTTAAGNTVTDNVEVTSKNFEAWSFMLSSGETIAKVIDKDMVTANFENIEDVDSFTIPEGDVDFIYRTEDECVLWAKEYSVSASVTECSTPLLQTSQTIRWSATPIPSKLYVYPVRLVEYYTAADAISPTWTETVIWDNEKHTENSYTTSRVYSTERETIKYKIVFRLYLNKYSDVDNYLKEVEYTTPKYVVTGDIVYTLAPCDLSHTINGRTVTLNWSLYPEATYTRGYKIEYTYDNSTWTQLLFNTCPSKSYSFTVPEGKTKIAFRICTYSSRSKYEQSKMVYTDWITL